MRTLLALLLASGGLAQAPNQQARPSESLKQVMRSVALPNAKVMFEVQSHAPKNDQEWRDLENAAIRIKETANLILTPGRLMSNGRPVPVHAPDYVKYAQALIPAGRDCLKAARMKSPDAISNCTDLLSQACDNCHNEFRDNQLKVNHSQVKANHHGIPG